MVKTAQSDHTIGNDNLSVDEEPGVQAINIVAADFPPKPSQHKSMDREAEYKDWVRYPS